jgi:hypothetical protein
MAAFRQGFPNLQTPLVDTTTGIVTPTWQFFLLNLFNRTGAESGTNGAYFLFPASTGATGQVLTSQGSSLNTIWTTPATKLSQLTNDAGFITNAALINFAPINSPSFTGIPQAPTPVLHDVSKNIATTEFVSQNSLSLNSPSFTGTPQGPPPIIDNNSLQLATTAFVLGQESNTKPLANGTASAGTSLRVTRSDHVHPLEVVSSIANPGKITYSSGLIQIYGSLVIQLNAGSYGNIPYGFTFPGNCITFICSNGDDTQSNGPIYNHGVAGTSSANVYCPSSTPNTNYRVNFIAIGN